MDRKRGDLKRLPVKDDVAHVVGDLWPGAGIVGGIEIGLAERTCKDHAFVDAPLMIPGEIRQAGRDALLYQANDLAAERVFGTERRQAKRQFLQERDRQMKDQPKMRAKLRYRSGRVVFQKTLRVAERAAERINRQSGNRCQHSRNVTVEKARPVASLSAILCVELHMPGKLAPELDQVRGIPLIELEMISPALGDVPVRLGGAGS